MGTGMSTPISVCLFYLEQEVYSPGLRVDNDSRRYFDDALHYLRRHSHHGLSSDDLRALVAAAQRRNRLNDLDEAVLQHGA